MLEKRIEKSEITPPYNYGLESRGGGVDGVSTMHTRAKVRHEPFFTPGQRPDTRAKVIWRTRFFIIDDIKTFGKITAISLGVYVQPTENLRSFQQANTTCSIQRMLRGSDRGLKTGNEALCRSILPII